MKQFFPVMLAGFLALSVPGGIKARAESPANLRDGNLVPWCIVPFDAKKRSPEQRAAMLVELGLRRCAYDWRAEHVASFEEEVLAYQKHGIEFFAFWGGHEEAFRLFEKYDLHPQIWRMIGKAEGATDEEKVASAARNLEGLAKRAAALGSPLGLYNHGGWGGEPKNLVAVCRKLREMGHDHVGIVYNFHHGHGHIDDWAEVFALMKPYLICLNLNGMVPEGDSTGRKIITLGSGTRELDMLRVVVESGYDGPVGILDHRPETDSALTLRANLDGLGRLRKELEQPNPAVDLARQFLQTTDSAQKKTMAEALTAHDADWQSVLDGLNHRPKPPPVEAGYHGEEHFSDPVLLEKHPDDLLYFMVPEKYRPANASGLIVFMHGGGKGSPRNSPARYLRPTNPTEAYIGDLFEKTGLIGVAPSAPWNEDDHSRWTLPESDDYLADVILECKKRFNIDADRVVLWGHSMGGFGAFHQVQRQPDRFASVISSAGSWTLAKWPSIWGTTFCMVHGIRDAEPGVRDRHTDIAYARLADRLLTEQKIPHQFLEHPDGHPVRFSKKPVLDFLSRQPAPRRDPFAPHIALVSPVGYRPDKSFPLLHNRWLTLDEPVDGDLSYDALETTGRGAGKDDPPAVWKEWKITPTRIGRPGAMIEAINQGNNLLEIATTNVARFTVWLHPDMVDFAKPVRIELNGQPVFDTRVSPSLAVALESFERRPDERRVYPVRITLTVPAG